DTRCSEQAAIAALQVGQRQLELAQRRVGDPRVLEALTLTARLPLALGDAVERELDRTVDRRDQRTVVRRHRHRRGVIDGGRRLHTRKRRSAASSSVESFFAKQKRSTVSFGGFA